MACWTPSGALLDQLEQAFDALGGSQDRGRDLDEGHGLISRTVDLAQQGFSGKGVVAEVLL